LLCGYELLRFADFALDQGVNTADGNHPGAADAVRFQLARIDHAVEEIATATEQSHCFIWSNDKRLDAGRVVRGHLRPPFVVGERINNHALAINLNPQIRGGFISADLFRSASDARMTELLPIFRAHFFPMAGHAVGLGELHSAVHRPIWVGSLILSHYFADLRSARSRCGRSRQRRRGWRR
jgi:hypothetical protein